MNNLTKLFADLISLGANLSNPSATTNGFMVQLAHTLHIHLPEGDCADLDLLEEHIDTLRNRLKSASMPSVASVGEFHGKIIVKFSNDKTVSFSSKDITHF